MSTAEKPRVPTTASEKISRLGDTTGDVSNATFVMDNFLSTSSGDGRVSKTDVSSDSAAADASMSSGQVVSDLYTSRDAAAKVEEDSGALQFRVIRNDGQRHNMIWLMQAKNLFGTQLPKMPREYIARLVLDRKHRSLLAIKNDRVVGGICFRPFIPQRFAEVAFLAVTSSEQIKVSCRLFSQLNRNILRGTCFVLHYTIGLRDALDEPPEGGC